MFPQKFFPRWANRETLIGNIMFPQQCFPVNYLINLVVIQSIFTFISYYFRFLAWKKSVVIVKRNYLKFNVIGMKEVLKCENLKLNEMK